MKKGLFFAMVVGLVFFAMGAGYAEEVPITEENVAQLTGKWEGERKVTSPKGAYSTNMEFSVSPLKAVIKYYGGGRFSGHEFPVEVEIKKGKIYLKGGPIEATLTLNISKSGKMMLEGNYIFREGPGSYGRYEFYKK